MPSTSRLDRRRSGVSRTAGGVSQRGSGVRSGVGRCRDDQIVTVPLLPLETAPESSTPVPTSSSSPAATAAGPDRVAEAGQVGQTSVRALSRGACCCCCSRVRCVFAGLLNTFLGNPPPSSHLSTVTDHRLGVNISRSNYHI